MAQVTLKIKIDLPGLREDLNRVIQEIKTKLEPLGVIDLQADTTELLNGLNQVTSEINETDKAAESTRNTLAQWGMILSGYQAMLASISQIWNVLNKPLDVSGQFEAFETQFEVLLGGVDEAQARISELADFAANTPFQMPGIVQASLQLQNLTQGALATTEGLTMVGNVAAGVNQPIEELSMWFGRLYDGIQNNRPVGEALMRLQELGALSGNARSQIEKLQQTNASSTEVWKAVTDAMSKYNGMMKKQSETYLGLKSTASDVINLLVADIGDRLLPTAKEATEGFIHGVELIRNNLDLLIGVVQSAGATFVAYQVTMNGVTMATTAYSAVTKTAAAATAFFSKAVNSNPIGLMITAVAGLTVLLTNLADWFSRTTAETEANTEANERNAESFDNTVESAEKVAENLQNLKQYFSDLTDKEIYRKIEQLNKKIADPQYSDSAIKNFKEYRAAFSQMLQERMDIENLSLQAEKEGREKELAELDLHIKKLRNEWVGNAKAQIKIDEIYRKEKAKINAKYDAEEKKRIEKHNAEIEKQNIEVQKLKIAAMEKGQAKELAQLDLWYQQEQKKFAENKEALLYLEQIYNDKKKGIVQKYSNDEQALEELKIRNKYDGMEEELQLLELHYNRELEQYADNEEMKTELAKKHEQERFDIIKKYSDQAKREKEQAIRQEESSLQQYFTSLANSVVNAFSQERRYSDAQIELQKQRYKEDLQNLKESLNKGEITQREYDLKRRIVLEEQSNFYKNVERDKQKFTKKITDALYKKLISMGAEYLIKYGAQKLAEIMLEESAEKTKTAIAQEGALARIALLAAEMLEKLTLAAASILQAIAEGIAYLFATMGPAALAVIPAMTAGVYALWNGIKSTLGFREGGYTGGGNPDDVAGLVHKDEYVYESELVSKEPDKFALLHQMLRSGMTLSQIFTQISTINNPIVEPQHVLSGVSLATPNITVNSNSPNSMDKIESLLFSIDKRLKKIEEKPSVDEIPIKGELKIKLRELYFKLKKEEKFQKNRGIDAGK